VGEFIVAHKIALLLIGVALGGFVLLTRGKSVQAAAGYPVDPYAGGSPSSAGAGGGFDLSSLLPAGPAGPALDPSAPAASAASDAPTAGEAPAAVDNSPVLAAPGSTLGTQGTDVWGNIIGEQPVVVPTDAEAADPLATQRQINATNSLIASAQAGDRNAQAQLAAMPAPATNDPLYASYKLAQGVLAAAPPPDAVDRFLANQASRTPASASGTGTAPAVSLPVSTPDFTPRPTLGHAVAV
jgi:hypothetical protein